MDTVITAPELPDVNVGVAGGGDFELFFNANVEPEKEMAYIVSLFCRYLLYMYCRYFEHEALLNIPFVL